jgi:hypothetical protein
MKDPQETEFIKQVKKVLDEYEEPYVEGSWEQFSGKRKVVSFSAWKWAAAAAMVLIIGSIWIISKDGHIDKQSSQIVTNRIPVPPSAKKLIPQAETSREPVLSSALPKLATRSPKVEKQIDLDDLKTSQLATLVTVKGLEYRAEIVPSQVKELSTQVRDLPKQEAGRTKDNSTTRMMDFLVAQSGSNEPEKSKAAKGSNWNFGVEVLPTMSNAAVNVGAGLTAELRLSKHFAVGSGISMVGLQAGKSLSPGVSLLSSKQLQSVDANLRGIDIPINIVFNVNKSLYTSVGVSYFNVIQERRNNTYVSERQISEASTDPATGLAANIRTFVSETSQETANGAELNGNSYLGFFNMSVGRKQKIFNKYNIYIEPFVKLPIGKLSQQELKLTNGGMKFRVSF